MRGENFHSVMENEILENVLAYASPNEIHGITNMFPTPQSPSSGSFIEERFKGLGSIGLSAEVLCVDRTGGAARSLGGILRLHGLRRVHSAKPRYRHPPIQLRGSTRVLLSQWLENPHVWKSEVRCHLR